MAIGTHWTACGWFLLACSSLFIGASETHLCNAGSWAFSEALGKGLGENPSFSTRNINVIVSLFLLLPLSYYNCLIICV